MAHDKLTALETFEALRTPATTSTGKCATWPRRWN
jgi:hypothetical protein